MEWFLWIRDGGDLMHLTTHCEAGIDVFSTGIRKCISSQCLCRMIDGDLFNNFINENQNKT